jgi:hypothetical protein
MADHLMERGDPPWLVRGLLDEPAHLATGLLLGGRDRVFLLGALLPDLDHVPLLFRDPAPGDPRPKTHSVWVALLGAVVSRRLAAGMLAHLARDLALAPGVPLFGGRHFRVPYAAYALAMTAVALRRVFSRR